jgi:hypothetical protein
VALHLVVIAAVVRLRLGDGPGRCTESGAAYRSCLAGPSGPTQDDLEMTYLCGRRNDLPAHGDRAGPESLGGSTRLFSACGPLEFFRDAGEGQCVKERDLRVDRTCEDFRQRPDPAGQDLPNNGRPG